jgi:hypothetical protein
MGTKIYLDSHYNKDKTSSNEQYIAAWISDYRLGLDWWIDLLSTHRS